MIQIDQLKVQVSAKEPDLKKLVASQLKINTEDILELEILKKSIDARKKPIIFYVYSIAVKTTLDENKLLNKHKKNNNIHPKKNIEYICNTRTISENSRVIVIGAGPAGLFAAYALCLNNIKPIIFERGKKVSERTEDILKFWETGLLDINSNVQFGEGGAGTFSDGKLNTLVNDKAGRNNFVLKTFVKFGAPSKILYEGKPHIGTDILKNVIENMRKEIEALGGTFHFSTCVTDFNIENGVLKGVQTANKYYECDSCILAIGHSARDTFNTLYNKKVYMEAKDFAVGFRIEHPQNMISESMYSDAYKLLEPAAYKLATNLSNERGVYSFCMCPGGYVVNSSSEENRLVVNGMSYSKRDGKNANSAIVVSVGEKEFNKADPLSSMAYQRQIEEKAFSLCNGKIPQQLYGDFKEKRLSLGYGDFTSTTKGNSAFGLLNEIFSDDINNSIIEAMDTFGRKIKGYDRYDAILSGVESRTSSPVRISRNELFMANILNLYPCGEGAGYAGGITSAAMDGLKVAEAVISQNNTI